ncbi:DUF6612 family protein [Trinickia caryophylli]|uniref:DUF6612 family protein n=1 Tax=Trinickia caryophylli TaxID=28094 RepID=UPI000C88C9F0|nr:DUF6612 family protein [Trinickia caryophylli]PMS08588.1 hypothetical protein C0Z17_29480 [Trinickia caryophylli]
MDIKSMTIEYALNKKTYLPNRTKVSMVMNMTADGQEITIDMKMDSVISKHNAISGIQIPEEALKATEMEVPATSGQ